MHIRGVPGNLADDNIIQAISSDDEGRYAIKERGVSIRYFAIYADFANALIAELDSGKLVQQISSKGNYDEELQGIKALAVSIILPPCSSNTSSLKWSNKFYRGCTIMTWYFSSSGRSKSFIRAKSFRLL